MRLIVQGRSPLKGHYPVAGNSNETIALIAASLLTDQPVILTGPPQTVAVQDMLLVAQDLGTESRWVEGRLQLCTPRLTSRQVSRDYTERLVGAILFLAPMLVRREYAVLEWEEPLGRLETHLMALRDLGQRVEVQGSLLQISPQPWQQRELTLMESSVTATALVCMLAAALGEETTVYNAACEPHLRSLQAMLSKMGARIEGMGSNLLHIYGSPQGLSGTEHQIQPDHIEAASIAAIGALTPGHLTLAPVIPHDMQIIRKVYEKLGVELVLEGDSLHVYEHKDILTAAIQHGVDVVIDTAPWFGFPSDLVAIATLLATQAHGTTLIHEKLYNNRLLFVDKLRAMRAQIVLADPHRAVVVGATRLRGEYIDTPDVRIGLALLGAALCAEGESVIDRAELIGRNFENVVQKLINLGAGIEVQG